MTTEAQALEGRFTEDGIRSAFGFSVVYNAVNTYRGSLDDVEATLTAGPDGLSLEGTAKVESISIREPAQFRAHVLGEEFFDADNHPEVTFRSTSVVLGDDGASWSSSSASLRSRPTTPTWTSSPRPRRWPGCEPRSGAPTRC